MVIRKDSPTYYEMLGIPEDATPLQIKRAFRSFVWKYHPNGTSPNIEKFKEFNNAYTTLDNPVKRVEYDRELRLYRHQSFSTKEKESKIYAEQPKGDDNKTSGTSQNRTKRVLNQAVKSQKQEEDDFEQYVRDHQYQAPPKRMPGQSKIDYQQEQADFEKYHKKAQYQKPPKQKPIRSRELNLKEYSQKHQALTQQAQTVQTARISTQLSEPASLPMWQRVAKLITKLAASGIVGIVALGLLMILVPLAVFAVGWLVIELLSLLFLHTGLFFLIIFIIVIIALIIYGISVFWE